ncbi:hypothetical protein BJY04DRAFT_137648 [Aspergillus karnatakaensis]|uniref:GPI anchored serine-threonine rich family protein n=1 Tax=Aspergillus karnatakaensis TaxID=1810916 RepID=UPI003CCE0312
MILALLIGLWVPLLTAAAGIDFEKPPGGYTFTAGKPTTINWKPVSSNGTVTIDLLWGQIMWGTESEKIEEEIPDAGSYTWTPDAALPDRDQYTVCVTTDQPPQQWGCVPRFSISGLGNDSTTATTTSTPTPTSTPEADAGPTGNKSTNDEDNKSDEQPADGLPPAAKAGIGGGVGVLVVVVVVIGACWVKRRKQNRPDVAAGDPSIPLTAHPNPSVAKNEWMVTEMETPTPLGADPRDNRQWGSQGLTQTHIQNGNAEATEVPNHSVYEMHNHSVMELPSGGLREMDGRPAPVELPTIEHKFV